MIISILVFLSRFFEFINLIKLATKIGQKINKRTRKKSIKRFIKYIKKEVTEEAYICPSHTTYTMVFRNSQFPFFDDVSGVFLAHLEADLGHGFTVEHQFSGRTQKYSIVTVIRQFKVS